MGNLQQCMDYQNLYLSQSNDKKFSRVVETAPASKYAIRLKKQFPKLLPQIEQIRNKLINSSSNSINNFIKQSPIYFIYSIQAIYQGSWEKGLPHGEGRVIYSDKSYYQGKIISAELDTGDNKDQQSLYIFNDASYYIGNFKKSQFQGYGKLVANNNLMQIVGSFQNGLPHGKCKQKFNQLVRTQSGIQISLQLSYSYEGNFINGYKKGTGKYKKGDTIIYQGQFNEGVVNGQGSYFTQKGQKFKGTFLKGNKYQGQLILLNANIRQKYNKKQKKMQGNGIYQWEDGKFYIGQFTNQQFNGKGTIYFTNGSVIEGTWIQGHNLNINKRYQITEDKRLKVKEQYLMKLQDDFQNNSINIQTQQNI